MKVLFVIPSFSIGGTLSSIINLMQFLQYKKNYDIDFFAINPEGPYRDILSQYGHVLGGEQNKRGKPLFSLSYVARNIKRMLDKLGVDITSFIFKKAAKSLQRKDYDFVIGFQEGYSTQFISFFRNSYKIAWVHCDYKSYLTLKRSTPEYEIYNQIDKVVCVSRYTLDQFLDCIPHKNATFLYNVILDKQLKFKATELIDSELFSGNYFFIVSVGRLHSVKQFCKIPQIIDYLRKIGISNIKWYLIGGGNEKERLHIINEKNKYNAEELVLLGEKANPYPYMAKSNLLVCTSVSEACPYVINEAKILGIPVVSTKFGSVCEFISQRKDGIICTIDEMPYCISELIKDKNLYKRIKNNLKQFEYPNQAIFDSFQNEILTEKTTDTILR